MAELKPKTAPIITKIEPVLPLIKPRLKVAAYARVSKETDRNCSDCLLTVNKEKLTLSSAKASAALLVIPLTYYLLRGI